MTIHPAKQADLPRHLPFGTCRGICHFPNKHHQAVYQKHPRKFRTDRSVLYVIKWSIYITDMASPSPTPERAVLGFVLFLFSYILFGVYVVWAYIPDAWLDAVGLTYWPHKHWAITLPVYGCVVFLLGYLVYFGMFLLKTPPLTSINTITDESSHDASEYPVPAKNAIPPLCDLSVSEVNRLLYLRDRTDS